MMTQTVLPFKCDTTDEKLTAHGRLALFGEFLQAMHLPRQLDEALPWPVSRVGYHPSQFVQRLLLMLHGGGRALGDLRQTGRIPAGPTLWFHYRRTRSGQAETGQPRKGNSAEGRKVLEGKDVDGAVTDATAGYYLQGSTAEPALFGEF